MLYTYVLDAQTSTNLYIKEIRFAVPPQHCLIKVNYSVMYFYVDLTVTIKCSAANKTKFTPTVKIDFLVAEMSPQSDRVAVV